VTGDRPVSRLRAAAGPMAVAAAATITAGVVAPGAGSSAPLVLLGWVCCLTSCAVWWLLRGDHPGVRAQPDVMAVLQRRTGGAALLPPARLRDLEWLITLSVRSAISADARLRPELRELACSLMAARHGIDVDPTGPGVEAALGLEGEALIASRRPSRPGIQEGGPSLEEIGRVVQRLEMI
jgi:hypothetical protein